MAIWYNANNRFLNCWSHHRRDQRLFRMRHHILDASRFAAILIIVPSLDSPNGPSEQRLFVQSHFA